jgi:hypothetical protein
MGRRGSVESKRKEEERPMSDRDAESAVDIATALGIEHTPERSAELLPAVATFARDIAGLWKVDVDGCEMAVRFHVDDAW